MAGTTTNFEIPYPSITDYVTDGATAMKSLADQVDAAMFTGSSAGNLLINGAMQVSQRSAVGTAVTGITTSGYNTADRWRIDIGSLGTWSQTTLADAPTGSGFRNCVRLACTTADASPAAGDSMQFQQAIEGQNLQAIRKGTASAKTLTLSFWVSSFQAGTFIVEMRDLDNARAVSKSYTVNASNTWEYKTITFPADTIGVLDNDANSSLELNWWIGAGTSYTSGTLQTTWGALTTANRAVGQTNVASSTSNRWYMTGAQLTVGSVATPFEFKSFQKELAECQRYYTRFGFPFLNTVENFGMGVNYSGTEALIQLRTPVTFRGLSTAVEFSQLVLDGSGVAATVTSLVINQQGTNVILLFATASAGGLTQFRPTLLRGNGTNSHVSLTAEL